MTNIDTELALDDLRTRLNVQDGQLALCEAIMDYWNEYCMDRSIEKYLLRTMSPIGLAQEDIRRWLDAEIISISPD